MKASTMNITERVCAASFHFSNKINFLYRIILTICIIRLSMLFRPTFGRQVSEQVLKLPKNCFNHEDKFASLNDFCELLVVCGLKTLMLCPLDFLNNSVCTYPFQKCAKLFKKPTFLTS